jgi:hypothetical protein
MSLLVLLLVVRGFWSSPKAMNLILGGTWIDQQETQSSPTSSLNLTILVLTDLIPLHPDPWFLDTTVASIYYHMQGLPPDTPLIIAGDGLDTNSDQNRKRWQDYQAVLRETYNESSHQLHFARQRLGISGLLRDVWPKIETEFVMVVQHDLPFVRSIRLPLVLEAMDAYPENVTLVRFNLARNFPSAKREWKYPVWKDFFNSPTPVREFKGINFTKTAHWSDNNHICRKSYYDELWPKFEQHKAFTGKMRAPERIMTMDLIAQDFPECERYCTHLYGAYGEAPYIYHLDGRRGNKNEAWSFK